MKSRSLEEGVRRLIMTLMALACMAMTFTHAIAAELAPKVIEISAGKLERANVPVVMELPETLKPAKRVSLVEVGSGKKVPCQVEAGSLPRVWWMLGELPAGGTRRYMLTAIDDVKGAACGGTASNGTAVELPAAVTATLGEQDLTLAVGAWPVLKYQHAVMPSADPAKPFYARSGFIHPVFDPLGRQLTEAMPPDHMHQHGIMFAWVNAEFEGRKVDFWNSHKTQGEVRHTRLGEVVSGPVFVCFTAQLEHVDNTAPGGPKVALNETWEVRVFRRTDGFLFDWKSTLTCAGESPLKLLRNDYGGLCVRGRPEWLEPGQGEFLTSEGKTRVDGNHTRPRWCDLSGVVVKREDNTNDSTPTWGGITVLDNPANFRFPQPVRLHPTMPYFSVSPVVVGPFTIEPGKPYITRYRFFAHTGKPHAAAIDQLWEDYAHPVEVRVVKE